MSAPTVDPQATPPTEPTEPTEQPEQPERIPGRKTQPSTDHSIGEAILFGGRCRIYRTDGDEIPVDGERIRILEAIVPAYIVYQRRGAAAQMLPWHEVHKIVDEEEYTPAWEASYYHE